MTIVIVCMLASSKVYIQITITSLSFVFLYLPVSEILPEGVIVVLQEYMYMYIVCYSVYCDYFGALINCCVSELHAKLCPHRNVCKFRCSTPSGL